MAKKTKVPDFMAVAEQTKKKLRMYTKVQVVNFFKDTFREQGFTDVAFEAWEKRKDPDRRPGGAILVDTTFLRNSIDLLDETQNTQTFGTHAPYAQVHNSGLRVRSIQNVRGYHRVRKGNREQVRPHFRKQDSQYPKRQFIGHSSFLMQQLNDWMINEIVTQFQNLNKE